MKLGDKIYVVVSHTSRTVSVVEGQYLNMSESGNGTVAWVDDSGLVSFAKSTEVFESRAEADVRATNLQAAGWEKGATS